MTKEALQRMMGGLIVSCQVAQGHPMHAPQMIATLARCAELGGARALRIDHPSNVRAVRAAVGVPIVGLHKVLQTFGRPLITPSFDLAAGLALAGADIIALEATHSAEVSTPILAEFIRRVHDELRLQVMADVSTVGEGVRARAAGADLVASTLSGFTTQTVHRPKPDLDLIADLVAQGISTVGEGGFQDPGDVQRAFDLGAFAVVVGTAITDPVAGTRRLVAAASGD